jgi:hypothetical protein
MPTMGRLRTLIGPASAAGLLVAGLAACGDVIRIPQAPSASAFVASSVAIVQQGNADVSIDTSSVTFALDDSRSLVAHLTLHSNAAVLATVTIRGSLYDPAHRLVGDLSGGEVNVAPGSTASVELTGPTPLGTIASATFEATAQPSPT